MNFVSQILVNGLISGCIYGLIAVGFSLIYGTVRFFHFAHGAVYATGAYICWFAISTLELSWTISVILACCISAILGLAIELCIYRPLRRRSSPNLILLLASFGIFILINNTLQLIFGAGIKTIRSKIIVEGHNIIGVVITNIQLVILATCIILVVILSLFLRFSRTGKSIRAVSDDYIAATIVGINSDRLICLTFFLSSALAGVAGILVSFETNIEPTMGLSMILMGIIAALIGGIGSIPGALLGGVALGLVENLAVWSVSAGWKDAIVFSVLILFLLFRPNGIFNSDFQVRRV